MDDRTAASVGFLFAGLALAASVAGWPGSARPTTLAAVVVAAGALAVVGLAAFGLRRYGTLRRRTGAALAGVGSAGVVVAGLFATFRGGGSPAALLLTLAGVGGAVFAYADWRGLGREALAVRAGAALRGVAIGALGIVAIVAWALLVGALVPSGDGPVVRIVLGTVATGAGTLTVVAAYLRWGRRDLSFLDVEMPGLRGLGYALGATVAIVAGNLVIGLAFQRTGVESASHTVVRTAEADPTVLLLLAPLSYLLIAPGEELLYRNVIQKSLRESFSPAAGVVVASVIFAAVHLPAYSSPDESLRATVNTLVIVFVLALVLGAVYERSRNVVVPILAHGTYNAVAFLVTYARLTGAIGG